MPAALRADPDASDAEPAAKTKRTLDNGDVTNGDPSGSGSEGAGSPGAPGSGRVTT